MAGILYPKMNDVITFREPYPRIEYSPRKKYYILVSLNLIPEIEMRFASKQQQDVIDYLIHTDRKLTNAVVKCNEKGELEILKHSPQSDFFDLVEVV